MTKIYTVCLVITLNYNSNTVFMNTYYSASIHIITMSLESIRSNDYEIIGSQMTFLPL